SNKTCHVPGLESGEGVILKVSFKPNLVHLISAPRSRWPVKSEDRAGRIGFLHREYKRFRSVKIGFGKGRCPAFRRVEFFPWDLRGDQTYWRKVQVESEVHKEDLERYSRSAQAKRSSDLVAAWCDLETRISRHPFIGTPN